MERDDIVNSAFKLGIKHFQSGNYEKALKVFTKAMDLAQSYDEKELVNINGKAKSKIANTKLVHPRLSSLLDSRAATFEKLGNYQKAGKDGEDLIDIDPINCKGYLRVAKILILLDSKIDAYKILSKGEKRIQHAIDHDGWKQTPLFDQLVRQKKELAMVLRKQTQLKRSLEDSGNVNNGLKKTKLRVLDPLERFPLEIFKLVLSNVSFREIGTMLRVCKKWNEIISNCPEFWSHVEIANKPISSNAFKNLYNKIVIANNGRRHKRIDFLKMLPRRSDEKGIMNVILNMSKLQIMSLQLVLQDFDLRNLLMMLSSSKLARYNFESLQDLKIEVSLYLNFENYLFATLPNLQRLDLIINGIKNSKNVVELEQNNTLLNMLSSNYKWNKTYEKLLRLSIICKTDTYPKLPFEQLLTSQCFPNLRFLLIAGFKIPNMAVFHHLTLQEIILEQNPELSLTNFLQHTIGHHHHLKNLYLREFKIAQPVPLTFPVSHLKNLTQLDLNGSTIKYDALIKILQATRENLVVLNIGACSNLIWQSSSIDRSHRLVNFQEIITLCPNLIKLSLNQSTNLTDFTLKSMGQILLSNYQFYKLDSLDLSFNNITGHGLVDFFQLHNANKIKIEKLIVDGNDIKHETLKYLLNKGYIGSLQYEFTKRNWKQFGVNSWSPNL